MTDSSDKAGKTLTVKDFNADEQPREKALRNGCGSLSLAELWAIVLRTGLRGKPVTELCSDLMRDNGNSLHNLERRDRKEILHTKGIGTTKAIQIEAVMELIHRYCAEQAMERPVIRQSDDIYNHMGHLIANLPHEEVWILLLNRRNQIIRTARITTGSSTASIVDIKKIVRMALLENAESLVLCHNHPSGNTMPSRQDDSITAACLAACRTMEINMIDHLIITTGGYYSYADEGRLR